MLTRLYIYILDVSNICRCVVFMYQRKLMKSYSKQLELLYGNPVVISNLQYQQTLYRLYTGMYLQLLKNYLLFNHRSSGVGVLLLDHSLFNQLIKICLMGKVPS